MQLPVNHYEDDAIDWFVLLWAGTWGHCTRNSTSEHFYDTFLWNVSEMEFLEIYILELNRINEKNECTELIIVLLLEKKDAKNNCTELDPV